MSFMFATLPTHAQGPTEYEIKAVYIYNLVNFVEWPASVFKEPSQPFVIGIAGTNVFGNLLSEVVKDESYRGRHIQIRYLEHADAARECQIVFITKHYSSVAELLSSVENAPVLTVSDMDEFVRQGGHIGFFFDKSNVKIEVNQKKAVDNQLQISSKLLRVAKIYTE